MTAPYVDKRIAYALTRRQLPVTPKNSNLYRCGEAIVGIGILLFMVRDATPLGPKILWESAAYPPSLRFLTYLLFLAITLSVVPGFLYFITRHRWPALALGVKQIIVIAGLSPFLLGVAFFKIHSH